MYEEFWFQSIKLKGGVFEPKVEVDTMFALRNAFGPKVHLLFDPNVVQKLETAINIWAENGGSA